MFSPFQDPFQKTPPEVTEGGHKKYPMLGTPRFSFNSLNQAEEWKFFYTRASDFPKALDINPDEEDQGKRGWHQIKMMFEGDGHQILQTLKDNNTISPEAQHASSIALNAILSVTKGDVHFWHCYKNSFRPLPAAR